MRNARIVWSLAALIIVLLGIGIGGYAQLGSSSSHLSNAPAIRAVSPTLPVVSPLPTIPKPPLSRAAPADPAAPAVTTPADPPGRPAARVPRLDQVGPRCESTGQQHWISGGSHRARSSRQQLRPIGTQRPHRGGPQRSCTWSSRATPCGRWPQLTSATRTAGSSCTT